MRFAETKPKPPESWKLRKKFTARELLQLGRVSEHSQKWPAIVGIWKNICCHNLQSLLPSVNTWIIQNERQHWFISYIICKACYHWWIPGGRFASESSEGLAHDLKTTVDTRKKPFRWWKILPRIEQVRVHRAENVARESWDQEGRRRSQLPTERKDSHNTLLRLAAYITRSNIFFDPHSTKESHDSKIECDQCGDEILEWFNDKRDAEMLSENWKSGYEIRSSSD